MKIALLKEKKRTTAIGGAVIVLLALIIIVVPQLRIQQSHADTNNIDPHAQFCRTYYHVQDGAANQGSMATLDSCQALDTQFQDYVQSLAVTYGSSSTSNLTPTVDPTPDLSSTTVATKNWPTTNLVALVIPADQGKNIADLPGADVQQAEDALTTYFQSHISTDTTQWVTNQTAIGAWLNNPFLQLATVTYSVDPTTGGPAYIDTENSDSTIIPLANFLEQDSKEVEAVQTDIVKSVKSTSYTNDGADCSFSSSATLSQSYHDCLGPGTIVDALYAENIGQGDTPSVAYNNAVTIVENEYTGPIQQYLQANQTSTSGKGALQAYNSINTITDKKLQDTYIDHILTDIVKEQPAVSTASGSNATNPSSTNPSSTNSSSTSTTSAPAPSTNNNLSGGSQNGPSSDGKTLNVAVTSFGFPDNDDGNGHYGTAVIAFPKSGGYPTLHNVATEGSGAYNDPITFAAYTGDTVGNNAAFPPGTRIYVPYLHKYFILEDQCADCNDASNGNAFHIDLWMGPGTPGQQDSAQSIEACEGSITHATEQIILRPTADHPVDTTTALYENGRCTAKQY